MILFSLFVFGYKNTMKEEMKSVLRQRLRVLALETRATLGLTQKEMSELLSIGERSYSDIESGTSICGTLTVILLLSLQDDPNLILQSLREEFDLILEKGMQPT